MAVTEAEALLVLPLSVAKMELRIADSITEHDVLLTGQIVSAVSHVSRRTGATGDALLPLRPAVTAIVRALYNGIGELGKNAAHRAWIEPFESWERG